MVTSKKNVLVVDDEAIVRESCRRVLTDAGYRVRTVSSGHEALVAVQGQEFDLVLTDIRMPDMDGLDVAEALQHQSPGIKVVIITGYPSRQSATRAEQLGIFDYLEKPLSPDRLNEATERVLGDRAERRRPLVPSPRPDRGRQTGMRGITACWETSTAAQSSTAPQSTPATGPFDSRGVRTSEPLPTVSPDRPPEAQSDALVERDAVAGGSVIKAIGMLALAPLWGLAFVVFLPTIGFGMLVAALGAGCWKAVRTTIS